MYEAHNRFQNITNLQQRHELIAKTLAQIFQIDITPLESRPRTSPQSPKPQETEQIQKATYQLLRQALIWDLISYIQKRKKGQLPITLQHLATFINDKFTTIVSAITKSSSLTPDYNNPLNITTATLDYLNQRGHLEGINNEILFGLMREMIAVASILHLELQQKQTNRHLYLTPSTQHQDHTFDIDFFLFIEDPPGKLDKVYPVSIIAPSKAELFADRTTKPSPPAILYIQTITSQTLDAQIANAFTNIQSASTTQVFDERHLQNAIIQNATMINQSIN